MLAQFLHSSAWLLAQADAANANQDDDASSFLFQIFPFIAVAFLAYFMLFLPQKQQQKRMEKLQSIKEKDHVITSGGIHGVITNVQRDQGRATLRVDESSGAKIKIELSAIARVISEDGDGNGESK